MSKYGSWTRGEDEALLNILGGDDVARRILRGELKVVVGQTDLLRLIARVSVNGAKKFVAKDQPKQANISWTNDNFNRLFADRVEENVGDATIAIYRLEKTSIDAPIMSQLGDRAEISLVHFFGLLEKQFKGEDGVLLTNGYANVAYIKDNDGNFWGIYACWDSHCLYWSVSVLPVPLVWLAGRQFLSRDS